jgi:hypothetical protein
MNAAQVTDKFLTLVDGYLRAGDLATPSMGLFTNTPTLSKGSLLADLVEPTYTGYARVALTLQAARRNANGDCIQGYDSAHFQPTAATLLPQSALGYFIVVTITAVDYLLYAEFFDSPADFIAATSGLDILFEGLCQNEKIWGGAAAVV